MSNARGTVLTWNGDKGVVTAAGRQYDFGIGHWKGERAPRPDMVVALNVDNGQVATLAPVADADLAKENLARAGDKGAAFARAVFADVGVDVAIGYGVFLLSALAFSVVHGQGFLAAASITLVNMLSGMNDSTSVGVLALLVACASIVVPHFWKHTNAALALCVPLVLTLYADYQVYRIYVEMKAQMQKFSDAAAGLAGLFGGGAHSGSPTAESFGGSSMFSLGFGFYATLAVAGFLALRGVQRYLRASH